MSNIDFFQIGASKVFAELGQLIEEDEKKQVNLEPNSWNEYKTEINLEKYIINMGYKNKTNIEYQIEYYAKNKVKRNQYHKDYYKANQEYIRIYQYFIIVIKNMNMKEI